MNKIIIILYINSISAKRYVIIIIIVIVIPIYIFKENKL